MTDLNLSINDLDINLGMSLEVTNLKTHKYKEPGLFSGNKKQPGQTVFWSKNCEIQCFNGKFVIIPFLDVKSGSDMMYGTSAYLFFTNKSLEYLTFQLVGNSLAANWIVDKFKQSATELLGEPVIEGNKIS